MKSTIFSAVIQAAVPAGAVVRVSPFDYVNLGLALSKRHLLGDYFKFPVRGGIATLMPDETLKRGDVVVERN